MEVGLDLANTIDARNSLEMMLSHQLAVAHRSSMKLGRHLNRALERLDSTIAPAAREQANVETIRLANAMARTMQSYQSAALTMERLRAGGTQTMTIKYVYVKDEAQPVVTEKHALQRRRVNKGGGHKNEG